LEPEDRLNVAAALSPVPKQLTAPLPLNPESGNTPPMNSPAATPADSCEACARASRWCRAGALLAINLLFLMVWGFTGLGKVASGVPDWFDGKFGATILAKFPGLAATFWILALSELLGFVLAVLALLRGEFLERKPLLFLPVMLVLGLFIFVQLSFGQWLTNEFNATAQLFAYFAGNLVCLHYTSSVGLRAK